MDKKIDILLLKLEKQFKELSTEKLIKIDSIEYKTRNLIGDTIDLIKEFKYKISDRDSWQEVAMKVSKERDNYLEVVKYIIEHAYVAKVKNYAKDGSNKWINEFVYISKKAMEKESNK